MNLLITLYKYVLLQNLKSFKFLVMILIALFLSIFISYIQLEDFKSKQNVFNAERIEIEKKKRNAIVYSEFQIPIYLEPNPLSVFSKGYEEQRGNVAIITPLQLPELKTSSQKENLFLNLFQNLDIVGIVGILSIFIMIITATSISEEYQNQTFKLIFTNKIKRKEYFIAKLLGTLTIVLIALTIIFIIPVFSQIVSPQIRISANDLLRIFLIFITCFCYLSIFSILGLIISSRTSTPSKSILFSVLIWIVIAFIYPNVVSSITSTTSNSFSEMKLKSDLKEVYEKHLKNFIIKSNKIELNQERPTTIPLYKELDDESISDPFILSTGQDLFIGITESYNFEYSEKRWSILLDELQEYQRKVYNIKNQYTIEKNKKIENKLYYNSFFIPDYLLTRSSEKFANTNRTYWEVDFVKELFSYRNNVLSYLDDKDAFGFKFFTQMPKKEMKEDFSAYSQDTHERYSKYENHNKLSMEDVPVFNYKKSIELPIEFIIILFLFIILFSISVIYFNYSKHENI